MQFQLICPKCSYKYKLEAPHPPEWEVCPICGHSAPFSDFWQRGERDAS